MSRVPYFGYVKVDTFDCPPFFMFENDDCGFCRSFREGQLEKFEPTSVRLWCALSRSATSIIDIGANVGVYSLTAAALRSDIPIHAFEPNPHAFARLRVNKHRNGFTNITEHQVALGHKEGMPITLTWRAKSNSPISTGSVIGNQPFEGPIETSIAVIRTFDALNLRGLGERPVVKIDVEGAEIYALRGAKSLIEMRSDILLESFHQEPCDEITSMTRPLGYRYYFIDEASGLLSETSTLRAASRSGISFNQFLTTRPLPVLTTPSLAS